MAPTSRLRILVVYIIGLAGFALLAFGSETKHVDALNRWFLLALRSGEDLQMVGPAKLHALARGGYSLAATV